MADGLSTLSTESLTAAVTSVLQKPLPDINVHVNIASTGAARQLLQQPSFVQTLTTSSPAVASSAVLPTTTTQRSGSVSTLSYLLNKPTCAIPTVIPTTTADNLPGAKKLKFSVDNLHLSSDTTISQSPVFDRKSLPIVDVNNSLSALQNLSTIQNILNAYSPVNVSNSLNNVSLDNSRNPPNIVPNPLQNIPTQQLQQLIQTLFQQTETSIQSPPINSSFQPISVPLPFANASVTNQIQGSTPIGPDSSIPNQRLVTQTLSESPIQQGVTLSNILGNQIALEQNQPSQITEDLQNLIKGNTLQQFPFIVQPSTDGGPVQLIPIGPSLDLSWIQILQKNSAENTTDGKSDNAPVTIQPKPPPPPKAFVNQSISEGQKMQPTVVDVDISLINNLLASQLNSKSQEMRESVIQPVQPLVPDPAPVLQVSVPVSQPNTPLTIPSQSPVIIDTFTLLQKDQMPTTLSSAIGQSSNRFSNESVIHVTEIPTTVVHVDTEHNTEGQQRNDSLMPQHNSLSMSTENVIEIVQDDHVTSYEATTTESIGDAAEPVDEDQSADTSFHGSTNETTDTPIQPEPQKINIFCTVCNKLYEDGCKVHNTEYVYIQDTPILTRARASLPACFYLQKTSTPNAKNFLGVWCKEDISERTVFGPVVGEKKMVEKETYKQQTNGFNPYKLSETEDQCEILCLDNEEECNWLMFVRRAHSLMEQNCVLYQDKTAFCLITTTEVKAEEELLMWYSADLCEKLGISQNPENTKLVQCNHCEKFFTTKKLLQRHSKLTHPECFSQVWACPMCYKKFSSNSKLNSHMMLHMGLKPFSCSYCTKLFSDASNLKTHMLIHTGQKKYKCETCDKTFRQKAHLDMHYIVHTGAKKYKCTYCDKPFARQADLKTHTYTHTQELFYTCSTCGKVFYKTQNYKRHLKVHTGERNYMCNKCFKGFQTKYHRDRHLKICKEKNGKESSYMSLEEVAKLGNTYEIPLKNVTLRRDGNTSEQVKAANGHEVT